MDQISLKGFAFASVTVFIIMRIVMHQRAQQFELSL